MSRNFKLFEQLESEQRASLTSARVRAISPQDSIRPQIGARAFQELSKLVQRLFLCGANTSQVVAFMGADAQVGCTWVAGHTSEVLASHTSNTVCVVEANWNSPALHRFFHVSNGQGLAEALRDDQPIQTFSYKVARNLFVIGSGTNPATETLSCLPARLMELRQSFDFVLLDGGRVHSGLLSLGSVADGILLVLKAGTTDSSVAQSAMAEVTNTGGKLLGAVLNQREYPIPGSIYRRLRAQ